MSTLDADMAGRVADAVCTLGADMRLGVGVEGFEVGDDGWVRAVATEAGDVEADIVVMGLGVRPNARLAADAGITIGPSGGIATNSRMMTSVEGVWAGGDCAESFHRVSRGPVSIALGTHANKHGRVIGLNITGTPTEFPGVIGTAITKVGPTEIARTGLNEREASAAGFDAVAATIEGANRARYYPDPAAIAVKVVAERGTGRMLGAQIVGGPESGKRIDALAVGVWNEMSVDDFGQLDLAYAPPFSPVWDPTMIAARKTGDRAHPA
jgi:NADPH-dependent 2,4-dienoyl-CoA reductase/sulfur reductase-like enzyme